MTTHSHRFGGTEYQLGKRELGHLHGEGLVDIPFPKRVRGEVRAQGLADVHHALPESGWVSVYLRREGDVAALLRRSFELAQGQVERRAARMAWEALRMPL